MEELQRQVNLLNERVAYLENENKLLRDGNLLPIEIDRALVARGFFKLSTPLGTGVLYATNGTISTVTGDSAGVYVATISGGSANNFMQVSNGIVTSI